MRTDIGRKRKQNEDAAWFDEKRGVFVVADGMGGHLAGEVASQMAIDAVRRMAARHKKPSVDLLKKTVLGAHETDLPARAGTRRMRGHGDDALDAVARRRATCISRTSATAASTACGGGRMEQLTQDHSLVGELVRAGHFDRGGGQSCTRGATSSRARSARRGTTPRICWRRISRPGDRFLLCTDGLTGMARDDEIERTLLDSQTADRGGRPPGSRWRWTRAAATM